METSRNAQSFWRETGKVWLQYVSIGIGAAWAVVVYALISNFDIRVSLAFVAALVTCPLAAFLAWKAFAQGRFIWAIFAPLEILSLLSLLWSRITTANCLEPHGR